MSVAEDVVAALSRDEFERRHDAIVRQEIEEFRRKAEAYLGGRIPEDEFRSFRLKHGVYGQRQPGVQMVRCKIPGGLLTARQMEQFALVADRYAGGKGHLTTRQNIQFHFVPLAEAADAMHLLADVGLTNREACYNTVRNVTACPLSGLSRKEVFDVRPYAQKLAYAFLRQELTSNLPRKFKIAFDGCADGDCIAGAINDIGVRAVVRDGRRGFRLVIGGGLGALPVEARLLDDFIPAERLIPRCEAVIRVFNRYGNRKNRNMARLKFVLRDRGIEWVKEQVEREYQDILERGGIPTPELVPEGFGGYHSEPPPLGPGALLPIVHPNGSGSAAYDAWLASNVLEQRQPGYASAIVRVNQGNLTSAQMRAIARLAADAGDGLIRAGIDQNLVLAFIPRDRLRRVHAVLVKIGLGGAGAREIDDVVTCPGAYSCNLALTKSMELGAALRATVERYRDPLVRRLTIKVSGCPNSCGQHWIADLGFYGNARKIDGREVPYYQMLLGGGYDEQGLMRFGLAVQSIPARFAPAAAARVLDHYIASRAPGETFRDYVLRHKVETFREMLGEFARPADLHPEIYQDWGDEEAFSLKLGRGECAA